jgi:hypothetical protein
MLLGASKQHHENQNQNPKQTRRQGKPKRSPRSPLSLTPTPDEGHGKDGRDEKRGVDVAITDGTPTGRSMPIAIASIAPNLLQSRRPKKDKSVATAASAVVATTTTTATATATATTGARTTVRRDERLVESNKKTWGSLMLPKIANHGIVQSRRNTVISC